MHRFAPMRHSASRPRARPARSLVRPLALGAAALVVALLLAEVTVRLVVPERGWLQDFRGQADAVAGALRPDLELGHVPVPGGRTHDEHGLLYGQGLVAGAAKRPGVPRILFLGDSVTARSRIVEPLCALWPGGPAEFLNAGIEAANPVQSVAMYLRHQQQLEPDHVVLALHNNDFTSTRVCLRDDDGAFVLCVQGTKLRLHGDLYDACALYRLWVGARCRNLNKGDGYLHRAAAVEGALRALRDDVRARGAKLSVLVLPIFDAYERWQPHQLAARERALAMLAALAIPAIDLLAPVQELIERGVDVLQTPGDTWHPGDACGAWLAAAAVSAGLFGEPESALPRR